MKTDRAQEFGLAYISIVEKCLDVGYVNEHTPVIVIKNVNAFGIERMVRALQELFVGAWEGAVSDVRNFKDKAGVQTLAFGMAKDFDQYCKLGFILGERLVLWDILYNAAVSFDGSLAAREGIIFVGCQVCRLKPLIRLNRLVILPHALLWSPVSQHKVRKFTKDVSAHEFGLAVALGAVEELCVNPYTMINKPVVEWPDHPKELHGDVESGYTKDDYERHRATVGLLQDVRFKFLDDVPLHKFAEVASDSSFQFALRDQVMPKRTVVDRKQLERERVHRLNQLANLLDSRQKSLETDSRVHEAQTMKLISASFAFLGVFAAPFNLLAAVLAGGNLAGEALEATSASLERRDEHGVLLQVFTSLDSIAKNAADPRSEMDLN